MYRCVFSAMEAELAALYINAHEAMYIRIILKEMGHKTQTFISTIAN
jgi:hypothetical protein